MPSRIAYIISQYPEFHETFIAREVEALRSKGNPPRIFSLKTPTKEERELYPHHIELIEYSQHFVSLDILTANLAEVFQNPRHYIRALSWVVGSYINNPVKLIKSLAVFPKTILFARKIRGQYDLLHAHWATIPATMAVAINILTGIKFSITAHAWDIFLSSPSLLREKISRSCGVITCTGYNVEYLKSLCSKEDTSKIHLSYHGLDFDKFQFSEDTSDRSIFNIIAVGRLVEQKGFVYLIRAVSLLVGRGVKLHLTIIGEGPLHDVLREEARQVPDGGIVDFVGRMPHSETINRMKASNLFVAPSVISGDGDRDGIPNVILEAMACSLPVIGTDVSGIPEVVIPGKTGHLVPPADPVALAEAILDLMKLPQRAAEMGKAGRLFVESKFDVSRNTEELLGYFEKFAYATDGTPGLAGPIKLTYIVSMFPCWSETFILNELVNHARHGMHADIFSLKKCNESMVHDEAKDFIPRTIYGYEKVSLRLCLQHLLLLVTSSVTYLRTLLRLLLLKSTDQSVKIKSTAVFAVAPLFISAARRNKTTHLHAHFATYPALLAWIINQFTGIPYTFTAHAHDIYYNQDLLPPICEDASAIVTISDFNKGFIINKVGPHCESKIKVIHCGIDVQKFRFNPESQNYLNSHALNILSIGRLSGIKGFTFLIDALRLLKDDGILFRCSIIGDGPLRESLSQQVKESGLSGMVFFLGSKKSNEIPEFLKNSDLFVLACATDKKEIHDGIPVVFMEAMAYGTPVIGTKLSGIPELIRHNDTGLCAEPEDAVDLCEIIKFFAGNRQQTSDMRIKARQLVEQQFNIETTNCQLRELFSIADRTRK